MLSQHEMLEGSILLELLLHDCMLFVSWSGSERFTNLPAAAVVGSENHRGRGGQKLSEGKWEKPPGTGGWSYKSRRMGQSTNNTAETHVYSDEPFTDPALLTTTRA